MKVTGWPHSGRRCRKYSQLASLSGDKQSAGAVVAALGRRASGCRKRMKAPPAPLPPTGTTGLVDRFGAHRRSTAKLPAVQRRNHRRDGWCRRHFRLVLTTQAQRAEVSPAAGHFRRDGDRPLFLIPCRVTPRWPWTTGIRLSAVWPTARPGTPGEFTCRAAGTSWLRRAANAVGGYDRSGKTQVRSFTYELQDPLHGGAPSHGPAWKSVTSLRQRRAAGAAKPGRLKVTRISMRGLHHHHRQPEPP
ncbi:hypothetical protein ACNKHP_21270 [Shigella boydii]